MILEGVVSNVTNFGAFVDIGVHQDGLVHISAMTDRFINDPEPLLRPEMSFRFASLRWTSNVAALA
jgi:uncharacterized protein